MSLQDHLSLDCAAMCDTGEFGEVITYRPAGGPPVQINAHVFRTSLTVEVWGEGVYGKEMVEVILPNSPTAGRTVVTVDRDLIEVKLNLSDAHPKCLRVAKIIQQDPGAWHLLAKV